MTDSSNADSTNAGSTNTGLAELLELDDGEKPRTYWSDAWRILKHRKLFWFAAGLITLFAVMALFPGQIVAPSPGVDDPAGRNCFLADQRKSPSSEHWFGTDIQGCDYFAQVVYGARVSLRVALGATLITVTLGVIVGGLAGFYGGWVDSLLMRTADGFFALPYLVGAIIVLSAISTPSTRGEWQVFTAIAFLGWPGLARVFRGSVLQTRGLEFVEAARAMGASNARIMLRHILPNAIAPVIVYTTVAIGSIIGLEATLTFLGIGLPLNSISWGQQIDSAVAAAQAGRDLHLLIFPALFLVLASLGFVIMGEELREAFDPRKR